MLNVITLFSGYDSQCLALRRLGIDFNLVAWSEIDRNAIKAHDVLFPEFAGRNLGDVTKADWPQIHEPIDLLTYSSPCQDFSVAGLQRGGDAGSGTRSSLLWEVERAIDALHPRYLLLENVAALVCEKFLPLFGRWCRLLESKGYHNTWQVLNAKHYGVPQNRERVFLVSKYHDETPYYFPQPFRLEKRLRDVLEDNVDERYYLSEEKTKNVIISIFAQKTDKVNKIGHCHTLSDWCGRAREQDWLIGVEGVSPTITVGTSKHPFKITELLSDRQANKQYHIDEDGSIHGTYRGAKNRTHNIGEEQYIHPNTIAPTVTSNAHVKVIAGTLRAGDNWKVATCAVRGRGEHNTQQLGIGGENTSNAITTVTKDSMVVERQVLGWTRDDKGNVIVAKRDTTQNFVKEFSILANTEGFGTPYESKEVSPTITASTWQYKKRCQRSHHASRPANHRRLLRFPRPTHLRRCSTDDKE